MLEWLASKMRLGQNRTRIDVHEARVWIAICLGCFFLLRISEVEAIRVEDVQPRVQDKWHHQWTGADAASVLILGSKTDQLNLGCIRTMHRVGGIFCPLGAMKLWREICSTNPRMEKLSVSRPDIQR